MKWLQKLWEDIKKMVYALKPSIFSIIILFLGFILLVKVSQGSDAVLALADSSLFPEQVIFCLVVLLWAVQTWYWARSVYILWLPPRLMRLHGYPPWVKRELPRILGILVFLVAAYASFNMAQYSHNSILTWMGVALLILALLFYLLARYMENKCGEPTEKEEDIGFMDFSFGTRATLIILTAIALIPLFLFMINCQTFTFEGTASIAILCISIWVPLGSWVLFLSHKWKLPVFGILIILAIIFGLWNDNHCVRVLDGHPHQMEFHERLDKFLEKYPSAEDKSKEEEPLYIVAAEGGGIRAAYWTALIMGGIQDKDSGFGNHIFAISASSGGSLGAAVYTALLKEKKEGRNQPLFDDAREILKGDFLSPTIAMMLTGDLLQKIIPFPIKHFSRALALEQSWEIAWKKAVNSNRFAESMTSLWDNDDTCDIPSLFLNGTLVETGQRIITSNIYIKRDIFIDALDTYKFTNNGQQMRLSTAVDCSARFPYISPPGTLSGGVHVVDGGYFDDSGAATALEIFYAVKMRLEDKEKPQKKVKPVVILFWNDPIKMNSNNTPHKPRIAPLLFLVGVRAPIETLLNIINAYSIYSKNTLFDFVANSGSTFMCFEPFQKNVEFPLGWTLSETVRKIMAAQAFMEVKKRWPPARGLFPCTSKTDL